MGGRPGSAMASGAGGIGGGGGGKIRTRRCHQGPVKPYQQGRPQHQVRDPHAAATGRLRSAAVGGRCEARRPTWRGPEGLRQGRGGDGKWVEPGPAWRRTRGVRVASPSPPAQGLSPAGAGREKKFQASDPRASFLAGFGGLVILLTTSRRNKGKSGDRPIRWQAFSFWCSRAQGAWGGYFATAAGRILGRGRCYTDRGIIRF